MGERRESNPRILEPQPSALTAWRRSPLIAKTIIHNILTYNVNFV